VPELVSILIPAYNAEKWIGLTIQSALNQTWHNKEIIIVNDGSSDKTLSIARQYECGSVKVLSQENKGAAAARNKALGMAQGDYIQWLDADDLLAPSKISEQMKIADNGRTSLTLLASPHGVFHWRTEKAIFTKNTLWQDLSPIEWLTIKYSENLWWPPVGWLVSRRLTDMAGPWDERLSLDDDGEYFCRVIVKSDIVKFVSEARCYYRNSGFNQQSRRISEKTLRSWLLSQKLCFAQIMSLENSDRIRRIYLELLQSCLPHFYANNPDFIEILSTSSREMGEELMLPSFGAKENIMTGLFGNRRGLNILRLFRKLKLATAVKCDEVLYKISILAGKKK